jgi:hypothetical protein
MHVARVEKNCIVYISPARHTNPRRFPINLVLVVLIFSQMSHYIRTIHTSFTSSSSSSSSAWASSSPYSLPSHSNVLVSIPSIMNRYPPGLTPDWRGPSGSSGPSPYNSHTKRRTTVSLRAPIPVHRRPAPPPPTFHSRTQPASTTYMKFDPFADENSFEPLPSMKTSSSAVIYHTSPRSTMTRPEPLLYTIRIPQAAPEHRSFDKEAQAKLVAGILLNRAQVGKPPRRRSMGEPKTYIKSGLSSVVSVEA